MSCPGKCSACLIVRMTLSDLVLQKAVAWLAGDAEMGDKIEAAVQALTKVHPYVMSPNTQQTLGRIYSDFLDEFKLAATADPHAFYKGYDYASVMLRKDGRLKQVFGVAETSNHASCATH